MPSSTSLNIQKEAADITLAIKVALKKITINLTKAKYQIFALKYFHWQINPSSNERVFMKLMNKVKKDKNLIPIMELVDIIVYYLEFLREEQPVILQKTISTIEDYFALCREHGSGTQDYDIINWEFENLISSLELERPTTSDFEEE